MSRPTRFDWLFRPRVADEDLPLSAEARFAEALAELPAVERSALALSEIGGLNTEEIAERLGTNPAVVQRLLSRARESVRVSLSARRGLAIVLPLQNLWQLGSSAPAVRMAGVVAAAIVAPSVVTGGAAADPPRAHAIAVDPPVVRVAEDTRRGTPAVPPSRIRLATRVAAAPAPEPAAAPRRVPVRPSATAPTTGGGGGGEIVTAGPPPERAPTEVERSDPPAIPEEPEARPAPPPAPAPEPAPAPLPVESPVELRAELPVVPPLPVPDPPSLPPLPPAPALP